MKKVLVVVDMQHDFIDGALGSEDARQIVDNVAEKIKGFDGDIVFTMDTHSEKYLTTQEGYKLPVPHCIKDTDGWALNDVVCVATKQKRVGYKVFMKDTFGSMELAKFLADHQYCYVEFVGLCTDICVISNAMLAKASVPEAQIVVDASCCAGVTQESHKNALAAMSQCQIEIVNYNILNKDN